MGQFSRCYIYLSGILKGQQTFVKKKKVRGNSGQRKVGRFWGGQFVAGDGTGTQQGEEVSDGQEFLENCQEGPLNDLQWGSEMLVTML